MEPVKTRKAAVDFGANEKAPEPPDVGIALALDGGGKYKAGAPVTVHGSYRADQDLIRMCREGLAASILITIVRIDKPWGETARLVPPKVVVQRPTSPEHAPDPTYREAGQFRFDLRVFFDLPAEPGRYRVEAALGPYHSERVQFEVE